MDSSEVTGDVPDLDSPVNKTDNSFLFLDGAMWVKVTNHNEVATGHMPSQNVLRSSLAPLHMQREKLLKEVSCWHSHCSLITS